MRGTKYFLLFVIITITSLGTLFSQGFQPPSEGKAVIYFARVSSYGGLVSFEYFRNEEFIGVFKGKNYMRYECPPGKQLFWASSEDKEFLQCDLEAGKTYVVLVNIEMGAWKARLGLEPITAEHKVFKRVKKLINRKKPIVTSKAKIVKTTKKLKKRHFVEKVMRKYEKSWKNKRNTKVISKDMYIPQDKLK